MRQKNQLLAQYTFFSIMWFSILTVVVSVYLNNLVEKLILEKTISDVAEIIEFTITAPLNNKEIEPYFIYEQKSDPYDYREASQFYNHILSHKSILNLNIYNKKQILAFSNSKDRIGETFSSEKFKWQEILEKKNDVFFIKSADEKKGIDYRTIYLYSPIKDPKNKNTIGIAEIQLNLTESDENINSIIIQVISFISFGILFVFVILFIIILKASRDLIKFQKSELIKNDLMRYFSPQVAESIITNKTGQTFGTPAHAEVAILFMDIRGFTSQAENDDPEEIFGLLNQFYAEMIDALFKNNGVLDKIIGDSLMGLFGLPVADEKSCDEAVQTAIEMQQIAKNFNMILEEKKSTKSFPIGIGINYGVCMAGNLGSEGKKIEYTVIGDPVNTAARLQGQAGPGDIIISEVVKSKLKNSYNLVQLDDVKLKGKEKPIKIYKVVY